MTPARASARALVARGGSHSKKNALLHSREAQRQLQAGWLLDPRPAKPVKILEEVFDDGAIYSARPDSLKSQRPYVTPRTPFVSTASQVKGLPKPFLTELFSRNFLFKTPSRYGNQAFCIYYLPPWHFLVAGRTTRPAISLGFRATKSTSKNRVNKDREVHPFQYAVGRYRAKLKYKSAFMQAWNSQNEKRDGMYVIVASAIPTNITTLVGEFKAFLKKVYDTKNFSWVETQEKQINKAFFQNYLSNAHYGRVSRFAKKEWE